MELATPETEVMLTVLAVYNKNVQTNILKSMVPDSGWFDRNQTKFENWQRGYDYSSRAIEQLQLITRSLQYQPDLEEVQQEFMCRRRLTNQKTSKISKIRTNLLKKSRQCLVTKAKQQMLNGRSKYSDRTRSTLPTL